jgi:hypothetical protein
MIVKYKTSKSCEYCFKEFPEGFEFVQVMTGNHEVLEIFGKQSTKMKSSYQGHWIHLCPDCFNKLHDLMEDCEAEGWVQLEDEEVDEK